MTRHWQTIANVNPSSMTKAEHDAYVARRGRPATQDRIVRRQPDGERIPDGMTIVVPRRGKESESQ